MARRGAPTSRWMQGVGLDQAGALALTIKTWRSYGGAELDDSVVVLSLSEAAVHALLAVVQSPLYLPAKASDAGPIVNGSMRSQLRFAMLRAIRRRDESAPMFTVRSAGRAGDPRFTPTAASPLYSGMLAPTLEALRRRGPASSAVAAPVGTEWATAEAIMGGDEAVFVRIESSGFDVNSLSQHALSAQQQGKRMQLSSRAVWCGGGVVSVDGRLAAVFAYHFVQASDSLFVSIFDMEKRVAGAGVGALAFGPRVETWLAVNAAEGGGRGRDRVI
jgi:hypothetical protein